MGERVLEESFKESRKDLVRISEAKHPKSKAKSTPASRSRLYKPSQSNIYQLGLIFARLWSFSGWKNTSKSPTGSLKDFNNRRVGLILQAKQIQLQVAWISFYYFVTESSKNPKMIP